MADVLFAEPGAKWRNIAYGPLFCLAVACYQKVSGGTVYWVVLGVAALVTAFGTWLHVRGGRRYVSVELTPTTLRNGPESLAVDEIDFVFAARDKASWDDELWETGRPLGGLSDIPGGRSGIGLRLRDDTLVRTWARDAPALRAALRSIRPELGVDRQGDRR